MDNWLQLWDTRWDHTFRSSVPSLCDSEVKENEGIGEAQGGDGREGERSALCQEDTENLFLTGKDSRNDL